MWYYTSTRLSNLTETKIKELMIMFKPIWKLYNELKAVMTVREIEQSIAKIIQDVGENCIFDGSFDLRHFAVSELYSEKLGLSPIRGK